jgi:hypothetical protein
MTWRFTLERVTGIEPALSAWELACQASATSAPQVSGHPRLSASSRRVPALTPLSGTQRARSSGCAISLEDRASFTWQVLYDVLVEKYEWKQVRLYGNSWWTGTEVSARKAEEKAIQQRTGSEQQLTDLLSDGWQIITVIPQGSSGVIILQSANQSNLLQEVWVVFLQRSSSDFNPPSSSSW